MSVSVLVYFDAAFLCAECSRHQETFASGFSDMV